MRAGIEDYYDAGSFVASAGAPPKKIGEAIKVILGEFNKITKEKVGVKELKKTKEHIKGRLILELEDSREVAALFGSQQLLEGKVRSVEEIFTKINAVTAEDVNKVAADIFKNEALNLAVIGPYKDEGKFVKILKL